MLYKVRAFSLLIFCVSLYGCSSGSVFIPPEYLTDQVGDTTKSLAGAVADASTAKEFAKYKAWAQYYKSYAKAYASSGFTMQYQEITLSDGSKTYLPTVSFKEAPVMGAPPDVSEHPIWKTANSVLNTVARWGFGYLAVDTVTGAFKSLGERPAYQYNGPVQMQGSYNTAGHDQIVGISQNPTYNATQTEAGGTTGGPDQYGQTSEVDTLAECLTHPPYGYNEHGTPMMTPTESCGSYFGE